ncbi:MAG: hypothetical protein KAS64_04485 [Spirochaetes bacterium]|nr:hypothetical protein [Spirochaetota bacterium]
MLFSTRVVFFIFFSSNIFASSIYLGTETMGLFSFKNNRWKRVVGVPGNAEIFRIISRKKNKIIVTHNYGIFFIDKNGKVRRPDNNGLPLLNKGSDKTVTGFWADSKKGTCILSTKHNLFISKDMGNSWSGLNRPSYSPFNTFTCVSAFKQNGLMILLGTSYNGLQTGILKNGKVSWKRTSKGLPGWAVSRNGFTYETLFSVINANGRYYAGAGFGNGLYFSRNGRYWKKFIIPVIGKMTHVINLTRYKDALLIETDSGLWLYSFKNKTATRQSLFSSIHGFKGSRITSIQMSNKDGDSLQRTFINPLFLSRDKKIISKKFKRRKKASNKRALYLPISRVRKKRLDKVIQQIKKTQINAVVIDMKDDFGNVLYPSKLKLVKNTKALLPRVNVKFLLKKLKKNKIYSIARLVVFKDKKLFRYKKFKYAIRDKITLKPWIGGHSNREYWVDAHSKFVWKYNVLIARELISLGFDEIQFDYIRFPTDGNIFLCSFPFKKGEMKKSTALAGFLSYARSRIDAPISIDVYGFNGWYVMGDRMGQDISILKKYVDVISPMYYPSHFGSMFLNRDPYKILKLGTQRAKKICADTVLIRPYLQAFKYRAPGFGKSYIEKQIRGVRDGGGSGHCYWNAWGSYKPVYQAEKRK